MSDQNRTGGGGEAVGRAQDAIGAVVGKVSASTLGSHNARSFVKNAAIGNDYELEAAGMAKTRTRNVGIHELAEMILSDHQHVGRRLQECLAGADTDVEIPTKLDERRQGMIDNLADASDDTFDERFLKQQVAAHEEAVTLFEGYCDNGDDEDLKAFARETVPALRKHLDHVKSLQAN